MDTKQKRIEKKLADLREKYKVGTLTQREIIKRQARCLELALGKDFQMTI